jgi:hypothetical protein
MSMRTIRTCAVVLALVVLAACGSPAASGGSPEPSSTTLPDAQLLALGKEVAQCFRQNGIPTFPDPTIEQGRLTLPDNAMSQIETQYARDVLDQAQHACQSMMDRIPQSQIQGGGSGDRREPGPGDVDALRQWAACVRQHGIPDWPDPKADGSFPLRGTPLETEGKSPRMQQAAQACQQYWSGGITAS